MLPLRATRACSPEPFEGQLCGRRRCPGTSTAGRCVDPPRAPRRRFSGKLQSRLLRRRARGFMSRSSWECRRPRPPRFPRTFFWRSSNAFAARSFFSVWLSCRSLLRSFFSSSRMRRCSAVGLRLRFFFATGAGALAILSPSARHCSSCAMWIPFPPKERPELGIGQGSRLGDELASLLCGPLPRALGLVDPRRVRWP